MARSGTSGEAERGLSSIPCAGGDAPTCSGWMHSTCVCVLAQFTVRAAGMREFQLSCAGTEGHLRGTYDTRHPSVLILLNTMTIGVDTRCAWIGLSV